MKSKLFKNIILSVFLIGLLSSSLHSTEPAEVIEKYADAYVKDTAQKMIGNVLAYKNIKGETIVLRSGMFAPDKEEVLKGVKEVPLQDIIRSVVKNEKTCTSELLTRADLDIFLTKCEKDNINWVTAIELKKAAIIGKKGSSKIADKKKEIAYIEKKKSAIIGKKRRSKITDKGKEIIKEKISRVVCTRIGILETFDDLVSEGRGVDLYWLLEVYQHTELQIQALWSAYENAPEDCKVSIKKLLPVALINDDPIKDTIDPRIYSLFEACKCCKETQWLNLPGKKDLFLFKIIDSQCGLHAKYMKKEGFMKQSELEELGLYK